MNRNPSHLLLALLVPLALPLIAQALPEDRDQPLHIQADQAERDEKRGTTVYRGKVELRQGSLHLSADEIILYSPNGDIERLDARGKPAVLRQKPAADKGLVWARGLLLRYHLDSEHLELINQASLEQDGSTVTSERIDYYMQQRLVKASGLPQSGGRVEVVLPPKSRSERKD